METEPIMMARTVEEASVPTRVVSSSSSSSSLFHSAVQSHHNDDYISNTNHLTSRGAVVTIRLDPHEEELFETLLQVADTWEKQQQQQQQQHHQLQQQQQQQHRDNDNHDSMDNNNYNKTSCLQLRVAGGWVRDKVLGLPRSNDVDISIDLMSGVEFATLVQQHYHDNHSHPDMSCSSKIGIIAANPDQSKHLETATMRFHFDYTRNNNNNTKDDPQQQHDNGDSHMHDHEHNNNNNNNNSNIHYQMALDVDFCQLRSQEVYEADSRIPTVTIGTAWEDAQRRDFTMNALFWNLRTRQIEDWTQRGLVDLLHAKKLETPLEASLTLLEDPLRALRAVRFAVRFGMTMDPALREACQRMDLHVALERKISRERVGKELEAMLSGKDAKPVQALELLIDLELASCVFCWVAPNFTPATSSSPPPPGGAAGSAASNNIARFEGTLLGHAFIADEQTLSSLAPLRRQAWEESRALLHLIPPLMSAYQEAQQQQLLIRQEGVISPLSSTTTTTTTTNSPFTILDSRLFHLAVYVLPFRHVTIDSLVKKKRLQRPLVAYFIHESIKFKNKDVQGLTTIVEHLPAMLQLLDDVMAATTTSAATAAKLCRAKAGLVLRATKDLWVTCMWVAIALKIRSEPTSISTTTTTNNFWLQVGLDTYRMIMVDLHLDQVWKLKPLLDGDAVIRALSLPRGPLVGKYLEEQVKWMLLNPQGSREECQDHLLSVKRRMLEEAGAADADDTPTTRQPSERHISKKLHGDTDQR